MHSDSNTLDLSEIFLRSGHSIAQTLLHSSSSNYEPIDASHFKLFLYLVARYQLNIKCANIAYNLITDYLDKTLHVGGEVPQVRVQTVVLASILLVGEYALNQKVTIMDLVEISKGSISEDEIDAMQGQILREPDCVIYRNKDLISEKVQICQHLIERVAGQSSFTKALFSTMDLLFLCNLNNHVTSQVNSNVRALSLTQASLVLLTRCDKVSPLISCLCSGFEEEMDKVLLVSGHCLSGGLSKGKNLLLNYELQKSKRRPKKKNPFWRR